MLAPSVCEPWNAVNCRDSTMQVRDRLLLFTRPLAHPPRPSYTLVHRHTLNFFVSLPSKRRGRDTPHVLQ